MYIISVKGWKFLGFYVFLIKIMMHNLDGDDILTKLDSFKRIPEENFKFLKRKYNTKPFNI